MRKFSIIRKKKNQVINEIKKNYSGTYFFFGEINKKTNYGEKKYLKEIVLFNKPFTFSSSVPEIYEVISGMIRRMFRVRRLKYSIEFYLETVSNSTDVSIRL